MARIYENSLSGIANKYVVLEPGPSERAGDPERRHDRREDTYSFVSLDQVFDSLDPLTRAGLRNVIRGEAASIEGKAAPATDDARVPRARAGQHEPGDRRADRDEPAFDGCSSRARRRCRRWRRAAQQLTELIANTSTTTGAIARQSLALEQALVAAPGHAERVTNTFAGLQTTLDTLDPLVAASKPAVRQLEPFAAKLDAFTNASIPTVGALNDLIHNPSGTGDLTPLALETPSLARIAGAAFPTWSQAMNDSQPQLDYLREYTPDVVAALTNVGQAGAYYDANGHYVRAQPTFFAFGTESQTSSACSSPPPLPGPAAVHDRCPGGAVQPEPGWILAEQVPGCSTGSTPPGTMRRLALIAL